MRRFLHPRWSPAHAAIPVGAAYPMIATAACHRPVLKGGYMSLQQLAWLGAAMSGVGVMLSFIYFAIQVRHNTRAVRASAFQQVVNSFAGVSFDLAKDKNLVDLFVRAARDFASLDEVERTQYTYMMLSYLRRAESVFFQTEIRMLHSEHWSGIRNSIQAVMTTPGAQVCWSGMKNRLNPEFRDFIDDLIAEPAKTSTHSDKV